MVQLESRQLIFWISVHCLVVVKPVPDLPRPHFMAVPFFLSFLLPPFCGDYGLFRFTLFLSSEVAVGQPPCCQGYGKCMRHCATGNNWEPPAHAWRNGAAISKARLGAGLACCAVIEGLLFKGSVFRNSFQEERYSFCL